MQLMEPSFSLEGLSMHPHANSPYTPSRTNAPANLKIASRRPKELGGTEAGRRASCPMTPEQQPHLKAKGRRRAAVRLRTPGDKRAAV